MRTSRLGARVIRVVVGVSRRRPDLPNTRIGLARSVRPLWRHTTDELLAVELDEDPDDPESGQCFVELDDDPPVVARTWAGAVFAAGLTVAPAIDATPIPSPRQPATTPAPRRGRVSFMLGFLSLSDAGLGALPP